MTRMMIVAGLMLGGATMVQAQTPPQTISRADFQARSRSQFALADANHDGGITKPELTAVIAAAMGGPPPAEVIDQVFASLDANGDGKATIAEVDAHDLERFDKWDTNHDGQLSRDEMLASQQGASGPPPKQ